MFFYLCVKIHFWFYFSMVGILIIGRRRFLKFEKCDFRTEWWVKKSVAKIPRDFPQQKKRSMRPYYNLIGEGNDRIII